MKKKALYFFTAVMSAVIVSACGKEPSEKVESSEAVGTESADKTENTDTEQSESGTETQSDYLALKDMDVESRVTLNEYTGMSVTLQSPSVSEEEVDAYIADALGALAGKEEAAILDRAVEEGDRVNINYAGTVDGVAFTGGTDDSEEGTDLTVGAGGFVPGFEEGIIGVMPGETVDVNVTFPEDYHEELAGKDAVFAITVNGIAPSELTEELLSYLNTEMTTIEEYRQFVYDKLMKSKQDEFDYYYDNQVEDAIISTLIEECTYMEVPKELVERYHSNIVNNLTVTANRYGVDLETYGFLAYGMLSLEDFEKLMESWAEQSAKQAVAFQAIANIEDLNVSDEKLDEELESTAASYGLGSVDEFLNGGSKEEYREYLMFENVINFLRERTQVTVE